MSLLSQLDCLLGHRVSGSNKTKQKEIEEESFWQLNASHCVHCDLIRDPDGVPLLSCQAFPFMQLS